MQLTINEENYSAQQNQEVLTIWRNINLKLNPKQSKSKKYLH